MSMQCKSNPAFSRIGVFTGLLVTIFLTPNLAWGVAGYVLLPTATFNAANNLTGLTGVIRTAQGLAGVAGPSPMTFQFKTGTGKTAVVSGGLINGILPAGNAPTAVPFPAIPAAVAPLGNSLDVTYDDGAQLNNWTMRWVDTRWYWFGVTPGIKFDPVGAPGITTEQSWHFVGPLPEIKLVSDASGTTYHDIIDSNFDVSYSLIGPDKYLATIVGDNSYVDLTDLTADVNRIQFHPGLELGTVEYYPGSTSDGIVDFAAIGFVGTFHYDTLANFTVADSTSLTDFGAPQFVVNAVPEASSLVMAGIAALSMGWFYRQRRPR